MSLGDEYVVVHLKSCYNSLNWAYLYDADVFFKFWVQFRILELISAPNQPRDSLNLFRMDTMSLGDEYVVVIGKSYNISLNSRYLLDVDVFFQFSVQTRILDIISVQNQPRDSFNLFRLDTLSLGDEYAVVLRKSCYNSLYWAQLYDADVFFQFRVLIRFLELISAPKQPRDSFNLFRMDTFSLGDEYVVVLLKSCYNSLNWAQLFDADVLSISGLIRFLELICVPKQNRDSYCLLRIDTLSLGDVYFVVHLKSCYNSLNWAQL